MFEAGNVAALHIYEKSDAFQEIPAGRVVSSTSNKLFLAPPPISAPLKSEIVLFSFVDAIILYSS
jgi:hypothetical protein